MNVQNAERGQEDLGIGRGVVSCCQGIVPDAVLKWRMQMKNEIRSQTEDKVRTQLTFCANLIDRLRADIRDSIEAQAKDPWDTYIQMRYHSRYENEIIRIRRELLKAMKMLEG